MHLPPISSFVSSSQIGNYNPSPDISPEQKVILAAEILKTDPSQDVQAKQLLTEVINSVPSQSLVALKARFKLVLIRTLKHEGLTDNQNSVDLNKIIASELADQELKGDALLLLAQNLINAGKLKEAIAIHNKILFNYPTHFQIKSLVCLGFINYIGGKGVRINWTRALHYFKMAVQTIATSTSSTDNIYQDSLDLANFYQAKIWRDGGHGVQKNLNLAAGLYKKIIERPSSQFYLDAKLEYVQVLILDDHDLRLNLLKAMELIKKIIYHPQGNLEFAVKAKELLDSMSTFLCNHPERPETQSLLTDIVYIKKTFFRENDPIVTLRLAYSLSKNPTELAMEMALNYIDEIITSKPLDLNISAFAYELRANNFKLQKKPREEILRAYFQSYLFGDVVQKEWIVSQLKNQAFFSEVNMLLKIQIYHRVREDLSPFLQTPPPVWIELLGDFSDFLKFLLNNKENSEAKKIVTHLAINNFNFQPYIETFHSPKDKKEIYDLLGRLFYVEAKNLYDSNKSSLARKMLENINENSEHYAYALCNLIQIINELSLPDLSEGEETAHLEIAPYIKLAKAYLIKRKGFPGKRLLKSMMEKIEEKRKSESSFVSKKNIKRGSFI